MVHFWYILPINIHCALLNHNKHFLYENIEENVCYGPFTSWTADLQ